MGLLREDNAQRKAGLRQAAKLPELFKHFKIDPTEKDRWTRLAVALAITHVPGMRVSFDAKSKGGRPRKWKASEEKAGEDEELLRDANQVQVQQEREMSYADVVRELLKTEKWGKETFVNLDTQYRKARRDEKDRQKTKMLLGSDEEVVLAALIPTPLGPTE